jgi:ribosomal protein S24E
MGENFMLEMRTVIQGGDVDQMGVVVKDLGGERVKVDFGDGKADEAGYVGVWVDRSALNDVTDDYNLAKAWGYTEDEEDEDDE